MPYRRAASSSAHRTVRNGAAISVCSVAMSATNHTEITRADRQSAGMPVRNPSPRAPIISSL